MFKNGGQLVLEDRHFRKIGQIAYQMAGLHLKEGKEELVRTRLGKRIRLLGLPGFEEYLGFLESDRQGSELVEMVEALTTHKTDFYRESDHFDFLRTSAFPRLAGQPTIRIWSAGCSTGEEPLTIAMEAAEFFSSRRGTSVRILATDLCRKTLADAQSGELKQERMRGIPNTYLRRYFTVEKNSGRPIYKVHPRLQSMITYARLNLMSPWPLRNAFQVIFCRNVMIYFDKPTQERLVNRFYQLLQPGGYFFTGHSESLMGVKHRFRFIQPAAYMKAE